MDKREMLIGLSVKYRGNYDALVASLKRKEEVPFNEEKRALTIYDEDYPKEFLHLKAPPLVLFYKGDLSLLKKERIAVVGSRNASEYSLCATELFSKRQDDRVIVSGMAKGIDAIAQTNAKETIGILGCGIDRIYPYENRQLYEKVEKEGLLLSEYPDTQAPYACHFPFRNRLIAALAKTVYIMEVREKSGTMTTVNEALELGKEVRVLPFDIFHDESIANNRLIAEGAGVLLREEIFER